MKKVVPWERGGVTGGNGNLSSLNLVYERKGEMLALCDGNEVSAKCVPEERGDNSE